MRIGIVGSEASKFTPETEAKARQAIRDLFHEGDIIVSGACHLGGIDIWAVEEAKNAGLEYKEYPPQGLSWPFYKKRNLQIVKESDLVVCITVAEYPPNYGGMKFPICYHCNTNTHVKSGGCWTMKQAPFYGKQKQLIVIT